MGLFICTCDLTVGAVSVVLAVPVEKKKFGRICFVCIRVLFYQQPIAQFEIWIMEFKEAENNLESVQIQYNQYC